MWTHEPEAGQGPYRWRYDGQRVSWRELAQGLVDDPALRAMLTALLAASEHDAIYWETVASSSATSERPFEMIVLPARRLATRTPSSRAFDEHLGSGADPVHAFDNLGRDARLVVPTAQGQPSAYGHLAAFLRHAPPEQVDALWQRVGCEVLSWWDERADWLWVSTAGDGVPWLHVRLDRRPKYYGHAPYRQPT